MPLGSFHGDDDLRERLVKVETELFSIQSTLELRVQLAGERIRSEINMRQGRTDIANNLVFAVCGLILLAFFGVVTAYFIGRPPGAPVSIRSSEGHP